jgi:mandelate racemase
VRNSGFTIERIDVGASVDRLPAPVVTAIHHIERIETVTAEIAINGHLGCGYVSVFSPHQAAALHHLVADLAENIVGRTFVDPAECWSHCSTGINFIGRTGAALLALSCIDTAVWDGYAQMRGQTLRAMLGADLDSVDVYGTGGFLSASTGELVDEALEFEASGYGGYKMKVGLPDWHDDISRVAAVREALADRTRLFVDANQGWSVADACEAGAALDDLDVGWLEEPVDAEDLIGNAHVASRLTTPVANGETVFTVDGYRRLLDAGAADILMIDVSRCGGPTGFQQVASAAFAAGVEVTSHTFTEVSSQLIAAAPTGKLVEHVPGWWDALWAEPKRIDSGCLRLPSGTGIGARFRDRDPWPRTWSRSAGG